MDKTLVLAKLSVQTRPERAIASSEVQPDLMYMDSVLVSAGENKNDDVFLPEEMWKARKSPVFKPVDWEHNTGREVIDNALADLSNKKSIVEDNQIIGVMFNSYATSKDGNRLPDDLAIASVPQDYDIVNQAVIYKYLFPKTSERIAKLATEGKLFVSMEAWFKAYDYKIGSRIVARNEETSFLDSYLRSKGGEGFYRGNKISRVLRDITFGGVGLVENPANKDSVIYMISNASVVEHTIDDVVIKHTIGEVFNTHSEEVTKMSEPKTKAEVSVEADEYKNMLDRIAEANMSLETKGAELKEVLDKYAEAQSGLDSLMSAIVGAPKLLEEVLGADASELNDVGADRFFEVLASIIGKKLAGHAETQKKLEEAVAQLAAIAKEKVMADRSARIDSLLSRFCADAAKMKGKKDKMYTKCESMSDELFDEYIAETEELLSLVEKEAVATVAETQENIPAPETKTEAEFVDTSVLENVTVDEHVSAGVEVTNLAEDVVERMKTLAQELLAAGKSK